MPSLKIFLLGSPLVQLNNEPIEVDTRKAIALLAYLALAKEPQSRSSLAALLWPDSTEKRARSALRRTLAALNKAIGKSWIDANRSTIELVLQPDLYCDIDAFQELLSQARTLQSQDGGREETLSILKEALDLYRGGFMEGFTLTDSVSFDEWQMWVAGRLSHDVSEGFERLLVCCEDLEKWEMAVWHARRWVQQDSLHEPAHRALMRVYALTGKRSAAIQQYESCVRILAKELGVEPQAETVALHDSIVRGEQTPVHASVSAPPLAVSPEPQRAITNLPRTLTTFIGRQAEMSEINRLLDEGRGRLVTIVGPGGMGKTRLAVEAATTRLGRYREGVFFIGLGSISGPEFLVATIAEALGFEFSGAPGNNEVLKNQLLDHLREKEMLLLFDNFEHVMEGADLLAEILQTAPKIQILVTSQQRLNILGEWLIEIHGLECPNGSGAEITTCSAVALFVERAKQVAGNFSLGETQAPYAAKICQLVGGLPLGIELAATWVPLLSCQDIARQIEESLDFLETSLRNLPDRHRSLRAVFEHSWQLLSETERRLFRELSVFYGGFQAEAAIEVVGASLPSLLTLVNKSLVHRTDGGRFEINQVLQQYAIEKFQADLGTVEKEAVAGRHARYFALFLHQRAKALRGTGQPEVLRDISGEIENIRHGWRWAVEQADFEVVDSMLDPLYRFYEMRSWFQEGADAFGYALNVVEGNPEVDPVLLGRLLSRRGRLLLRLSRHDEGRQAMERALDLLPEESAPHERVAVLGILGVTAEMAGNSKEAQWRQEETLKLAQAINDQWGMANALLRLGNVVYGQGAYDDARNKYRQSLDLWRQLDDRRGISVCLNNLGSIADTLGDYQEARQLYEESLALKRELGDRRGMAYSLNNTGYVKCLLGELGEARADLEKSLTLFREIGDRKGISYVFTNLGNIAFASEDYEEAARLYKQGLESSRKINFKLGLAYGRYHLGATALRQNHLNRSRELLMEGLDLAQAINALPVVLEILVEIANLLIHENHTARAAAVLQAVRQHPSSRRHVRDAAEAIWNERFESKIAGLDGVEPVEIDDADRLIRFIS